MQVKLIAAISLQGILAVDGKIPWNKPADLKRFRLVTDGSTLIMGRKTWESIGKRRLPGRRTIVLSKTQQEGVKTAFSIEEALDLARDLSWSDSEGIGWHGSTTWVIGGAIVYDLALPYVSEIDLTLVIDDAVYVETKSDEDHVTRLSFPPEGLVEIESLEGRVTRLSFYPEGFVDFKLTNFSVNPSDSNLIHCTYTRK